MNVAIILSGGSGKRLGEAIPKQYLMVDKKPLLLYCIEPLQKSRLIDKIQIVASDEWVDKIKKWLSEYKLDKKLTGFSRPGENRQLSIYNGLVDLKKQMQPGDNVFIHDAARPNLSEDIIERSIEGMEGYDGVIPVLPMKDTVYFSNDGESIDSLLDRAKLYAGQAPETFDYEKYLLANEKLVASGEILKINGSSEPAVMANMKMHMIAGDEKNYKITTKGDLNRFIEQIKVRE